MKLINIDTQLAKKYYDTGKNVLYLTLIPYKNNTCIKAYTDEGEPLGDVEENFIAEYITQDKIIMFINQVLNDETGLFEYTINTLL